MTSKFGYAFLPLKLRVFSRKVLSLWPFTALLSPLIKTLYWRNSSKCLNSITNSRISCIVPSVFYEYIDPYMYGNTCHILCSGSSIYDSINLVNSNDFVLGFNSSLALPINHDLYFMEAYSFNHNELLTALTYLFRQSLKIANPTEIVLKNSQSKLIDFDQLTSDIPSQSKLYLMPDIVLPTQTFSSIPSSSRHLVRDLLCDNNVFYTQAILSVYTFIILAYRLGFKNIILHGFDLCGSHFYCNPRFLDFEISTVISSHINTLFESSRAESTTYEASWYNKMNCSVLDAFRHELLIKEVNLISALNYGIAGQCLPCL